jgi:hypothetical protein
MARSTGPLIVSIPEQTITIDTTKGTDDPWRPTVAAFFTPPARIREAPAASA